MLHPDDGSVESWTAEASADKMRADFEGWEPRYVLQYLSASSFRRFLLQSTTITCACAIDAELETNGSSSFGNVGASSRDARTSRRCLPSNACASRLAWRSPSPYLTPVPQPYRAQGS